MFKKEEKKKLEDIILNKAGPKKINAKILLAISTLSIILMIVIMLLNSLQKNVSKRHMEKQENANSMKIGYREYKDIESLAKFIKENNSQESIKILRMRLSN